MVETDIASCFSAIPHGKLMQAVEERICQAERALERLTAVPAGLGLEPKAAKTRIVHLEVGGGGLDFLGFHHRLVRSRGLNGKKPVTFLARGQRRCSTPATGYGN